MVELLFSKTQHSGKNLRYPSFKCFSLYGKASKYYKLTIILFSYPFLCIFSSSLGYVHVSVLSDSAFLFIYPSGSIVVTVKLKAKYRFKMAAVLFHMSYFLSFITTKLKDPTLSSSTVVPTSGVYTDATYCSGVAP
jgi:hypothetical protein